MSIASVNERISAVHVGLPWRGLFPIPDAQINANDRAHVATFMGLHFTPVITSTTKLELPVDYQMAGDLPIRAGRAGGRGLRHTFGE
jgi:hypothetical protein